MGKYLADEYLDSVLENYFEEDNLKIFESCMTEYLIEGNKLEIEPIEEAKSPKEKEKNLQKRIKWAKNVLINQIGNKVKQNSKKYKKFIYDNHQVTRSELIIYYGKETAQSIISGTISLGTQDAIISVGSGISAASNAGGSVMKGAVTGAKLAIKDIPTIAGASLVVGAVGTLINLLIRKGLYKKLYTTKLYGVDDNGKKKLIGWWLSVQVNKSELPKYAQQKM